MRIAILAALTVTALAPAQASKPTKKPKWPKPTAAQTSKAKLLIRKLSSDDEDVVDEAVLGLGKIGAPIAKMLLRELGRADDDGPEPMRRALDLVVKVEHAPLIAPMCETDEKRPTSIKRYVMLRLAKFGLPEYEPQFRDGLASEDPELVFLGSLGLCGIGKFEDAFDNVFDRCVEDWRGVAKLVDSVLATQRSAESSRFIIKYLNACKDEEREVTAIHLMRSLCTREFAMVLKNRLDSSQRNVMTAAVNALRVIVDGAAPIENLSAFQAIEHARKWKERI